jgi:hypothetical protein
MLCFKMTNYLNFQALFTIALPSNLECICRCVNLAVGEPTRQYMLAFTAATKNPDKIVCCHTTSRDELAGLILRPVTTCLLGHHGLILALAQVSWVLLLKDTP